MITTVLIDLDDTLLRNPDARFIPSYIERLSRHLSPLKPTEAVKDQLYQGALAMQANADPERMLKDVFNDSFFPALDLNKEDARPLVQTFFAEEYPKLRALTDKKPNAESLIRHVMETDLEVVIATNPIYPSTAIAQRLEWAGIPAHSFAYHLVTSCENSHFTKPHPEYYAEILAKLGRNSDCAVMIGNDLQDDIEPAERLGISAFHLGASDAESELDSARAWIDGPPASRDPLESATPESLIARLRGDLAAYHDLFSRSDTNHWDQRPNPESWAVVEILAHLRDVELEVNQPRIEAILYQDEPFLSALDSDRWAEERDYLHQDPTATLTELCHARRKTIASLLELRPEQWRRPARHSIFGPTNLLELVLIFLDHDLTHMRQLRDVFGTL